MVSFRFIRSQLQATTSKWIVYLSHDSKFIEYFPTVGVSHKCMYAVVMYDRLCCDSHQFKLNRLPIRSRCENFTWTTFWKTANFILYCVHVCGEIVISANSIRIGSIGKHSFFSLSWLKWKYRQNVITGVLKLVAINKNPLENPLFTPLKYTRLNWKPRKRQLIVIA